MVPEERTGQLVNWRTYLDCQSLSRLIESERKTLNPKVGLKYFEWYFTHFIKGYRLSGYGNLRSFVQGCSRWHWWLDPCARSSGTNFSIGVLTNGPWRILNSLNLPLSVSKNSKHTWWRKKEKSLWRCGRKNFLFVASKRVLRVYISTTLQLPNSTRYGCFCGRVHRFCPT